MTVRRIAAVLMVLVAIDAVAQVETCRFRAGDRDDPFRRWLASGEVVCSTSPALPTGSWNVFARGASGVSGVVLVEGGAAPELPLRPAATLTATLPPQARAVAWAPRLGSGYPIVERTLVPAAEPLWLFVLQQSIPIAVLPIGTLSAGVEQQVDARGGGASAVIGWLSVPDEDRAALRSARGLSTPPIFARAGGATRDPDLLPPLDRLHGAFVRIPNVPAGEGEVLVQGRGWITDRHRIKVEAPLTVVRQPLSVRAAGSVGVGWSTHLDLAELERSLGGCSREEETKGEITLSRCSQPDSSTCTAVRTEPFDPAPKIGSFTVDELPPGVYRAELKFGRLPPVSMAATIGPLQHKQISLWVDFDEIHGSLTRGGEPLGADATLTFPNGYGFASAEKSEYRAVLRSGGGWFDVPVTVAACDGDPRVIVLTGRAAPRSPRLDIDIPVNKLTITVEDTFTREALSGSTIRMDVLAIRTGQPTAASRVLKAKAGNRGAGVEATAIPPDHPIVLEVSHPGYQKQRVERFSLTKSEEKTVPVQLVPLRGNRGQILSQRPFAEAAIFWMSASGRETERADVATDGTFVFSTPHDGTETIAVVSASHPLWVARSPQTPDGDLMTIRFPDTSPVRAFEVVLTGGDPRVMRHVGLAIGGMRVPSPALRQHQTLRRMPFQLRGAGPMPIRDLAETGPIDVILGSEINERPGVSEPVTVRLPPGATRLDLRGPT